MGGDARFLSGLAVVVRRATRVHVPSSPPTDTCIPQNNHSPSNTHLFSCRVRPFPAIFLRLPEHWTSPMQGTQLNTRPYGPARAQKNQTGKWYPQIPVDRTQIMTWDVTGLHARTAATHRRRPTASGRSARSTAGAPAASQRGVVAGSWRRAASSGGRDAGLAQEVLQVSLHRR